MLATQIYSLARYSKRTIGLRRGLSHYNYQVSRSFDSLSRVLFSFPSRYFCSIGLRKYLGLEVDDSQIPASYPRDSTLDTLKVRLTSTGLSPSAAPLSRGVRFSRLGSKECPKHHIPAALLQQIRFALCCFLSLILTASQLISFPSGTKMFPSPEFAIR